MKKLLPLFVLSCASLAFGQGVVVAPQSAFKVINGLTTPIANATVTVCASLTGGIPCSPALANATFRDAALTQPLTNPFTADSVGNYQFAIAPGNYTVTVTSSGFVGQSYQLTVATPISLAGGLGDPGANGVVFRNGLNTTRVAASADVIALFAGTCSVSTFVRGDGACASAGIADPGSNGIMKRTALNVTAIAASSDIIALFTGCSGIQYLGADGACHSALSSLAFSGITGGTNTTAAMLVGTGASLLPNAQGQISGITDWYSPYPTVAYPSQPTLTGALTGGALPTSTTMFVKLTFVGAPTIVPSAEVRIDLNTATNCASGSLCTVTVNMPSECTAPAAPVTGCTVWDVTGSANIGLEKQQTASAACVNITAATCVIGTAATGASLSTPVTTGTNPPNLQALASTPDNIVPSLFIQKGDNKFYPLAGVDISALNALPQPAGTFTWLDRFFVNDSIATAVISNSLVSIDHMSGNLTSTGVGIDDRALSVKMVDSATVTPTYEQSLTQYNERIISNNNFNCAPVGNGAVGESCDAAGRFITSDTRSAAVNNVTLEALAGVASYAHTSGGLGSCAPCVIGVKGGAFEATTSANAGGAIFAGGFFSANGSTSNSNGTGVGVYVPTPAVRFASQNIGFRSLTQGTNVADWDVLMDGDGNTGGRSMFQGNVYLPHIVPDNGTLPIDGSVSVTGGVSTGQNSTPGFSGITNFGTAGASTDVYKGTCVDVNGAETAATAAAQTTTANADLTAVHGNNINILTQVGCSSYNIYRTSAASTCNGGACTNGKIGNIVPGLMTSASNNPVTFQDTGQVGDGNTAVAQANTTGGEVIAGIVRWGNTQRRAASDFTTSSGTLVTLFSWNLPITTTNYSFRCDLVYSQQTAAAGLLLGIQSATVSPTSMMASARIYSTVTGTSTDATSVITNTTATTVLTGAAPAAINTNYQASLYGSIENVGANVLNVMVATANVADQITILRGSACHLF
jgi:hypothetical protein